MLRRQPSARAFASSQRRKVRKAAWLRASAPIDQAPAQLRHPRSPAGRARPGVLRADRPRCRARGSARRPSPSSAAWIAKAEKSKDSDLEARAVRQPGRGQPARPILRRMAHIEQRVARQIGGRLQPFGDVGPAHRHQPAGEQGVADEARHLRAREADGRQGVRAQASPRGRWWWRGADRSRDGWHETRSDAESASAWRRSGRPTA